MHLAVLLPVQYNFWSLQSGSLSLSLKYMYCISAERVPMMTSSRAMSAVVMWHDFTAAVSGGQSSQGGSSCSASHWRCSARRRSRLRCVSVLLFLRERKEDLCVIIPVMRFDAASFVFPLIFENEGCKIHTFVRTGLCLLWWEKKIVVDPYTKNFFNV